jgi:hypothetical protein
MLIKMYFEEVECEGENRVHVTRERGGLRILLNKIMRGLSSSGR